MLKKLSVIKSKKSPLQAAETRALGSPEGSNAILPSGRRSRGGIPLQAKSIKETISAACGRVVEPLDILEQIAFSKYSWIFLLLSLLSIKLFPVLKGKIK